MVMVLMIQAVMAGGSEVRVFEEPVNRARVCGKAGKRPTAIDVAPWTQRKIFLMRMRKAASSTVCCVLEEYGLVEVLEERRPLNAVCVPRPLVVSVTHLRHPVERLRSDYWYVGPGKRTGNETEALWFEWMGMAPPRNCQFTAGWYFDNYYARRLLGSCGECDASRPRLDDDLGELHVFGCGVRSEERDECSARRALGDDDLAAARLVLARFDVVLVLEDLRASVFALVRALHLPTDLSLSLAARLLTLRIDHYARTNNGTSGSSSRPPEDDRVGFGRRHPNQLTSTLPRAVSSALYARHAYDLTLWNDARARIATSEHRKRTTSFFHNVSANSPDLVPTTAMHCDH